MNVAPIADDHERDREVREPDRERAPQAGPVLDERDERIEREREEDRDQDPRDHVPRDPDHLEQDRDRDDREQDPQQGPRANLDDPIAHRGKASLRSRTTATGRPPEILRIRLERPR